MISAAMSLTVHNHVDKDSMLHPIHRSPPTRHSRSREGPVTLDLDRRELKRGSQLVALEPQVFDLLVYLVQNRDRVVSKDDLIDGVWGGRIVSESTLTTRLNAVRKAVGDSGAAQRLIRTVPRRGVRFIGEVSEDSETAARGEAIPAATVPPVAPRLS